MANIYRLILVVLIGLFSSSTFAVIQPIQLYNWQGVITGSASELVAYFKGQQPMRNCGGGVSLPLTWYAKNANASSVEFWASSQGCPGYGPYDVYQTSASAAGSSCPVGSALSGGSCQCNSPLVEVGGQCKPPACPAGQHEEGGACVPDDCKPDESRVNGVCVKDPPCPAGQTRVNGVCKKNGCEVGKSVGERITDGDTTTFGCEDGCTVRINPSVCVKYGDVVECVGTGRLTGAKCTPGEGGGSNPGSGGTGGGENNGGTGNGGTGNGGTGNGGTGTGSGGTGTGTGGGGTGTGTGGGGTGTGSGGTGSGGTGEGGTGSGGTGSGGTGSGGTGSGSGSNGPGYPPPIIIPPAPDGTCPTGTHKSGNTCIKDPVPPDGDGKCPEGSVKINGKCVYTEPPTGGGGGTGTGGGGTGSGNGEGNGEEGSGFGGSCMSGFACEGDAIQCAIAKEQYRRNCQMFEDKSPESELYEAEKKKDRNRDVTKDLPGNEEIDVSSRLSRLNVLGAAACIGDLSVTVWHTQITLPFSSLCAALEQLGWILVVVSSIAAARIVTKT